MLTCIFSRAVACKYALACIFSHAVPCKYALACIFLHAVACKYALACNFSHAVSCKCVLTCTFLLCAVSRERDLARTFLHAVSCKYVLACKFLHTADNFAHAASIVYMVYTFFLSASVFSRALCRSRAHFSESVIACGFFPAFPCVSVAAMSHRITEIEKNFQTESALIHLQTSVAIKSTESEIKI